MDREAIEAPPGREWVDLVAPVDPVALEDPADREARAADLHPHRLPWAVITARFCA